MNSNQVKPQPSPGDIGRHRLIRKCIRMWIFLELSAIIPRSYIEKGVTVVVGAFNNNT